MDTQRRPLLRGEAAVRLRGGVCDGRSKAAKRIGKTDHLQRCHEAIYPLGIFRQAETQHGAVGFGPEQAQGELAVGMAFKAWMIDLFDEGVGFKGGGKLNGVPVLLLQAELEAARPSQDQPADKGGKAAADEGAQELGPLNGFLIGDYGAADGIEMPVDILGQAVHHNIRAERQRLYDVGRRIGVVDHQLGPGGVGHVRGPPDVEQHGQGVRDDFAIKKTGIRTNGP